MKILGSGDFKYELVDTWPKMPKYWEFGIASDVYVNSSDEIHVFSRGLHPLTIWDKDGNFISSWGEGTFSNNEHGIYITKKDTIWLVDSWFHIATEHKPDGTLITGSLPSILNGYAIVQPISRPVTSLPLITTGSFNKSTSAITAGKLFAGHINIS